MTRIDKPIPVSAAVVESARQVLFALADRNYTIGEVEDIVNDIAIELAEAQRKAGIYGFNHREGCRDTGRATATAGHVCNGA